MQREDLAPSLPAVRTLTTLHISYTMERVFSTLPDAKGCNENKLKSCEKRLMVNCDGILNTLFYHFLIRFIFKMPGSPVWSIKHHINLFQRFMILPENDPKCWLLEISSCTFLPKRITGSFPIMFWRKGFVLLHSLQAKTHPSDWQDLQRGTSFHLFLRIDGPFPSSMKQWVSLLFYNFSRKFS